MNTILNLAEMFIFLAIGVESVFLILQLRGRLMSAWFGKSAFAVHATTTAALWTISFIFIALLQAGDHPPFHTSRIFSLIGLAVGICGLCLSTWAFFVLGIKRALCANFYYSDISPVNTFPYGHMKNPMDMGFWAALLGFAAFTGSYYNLAIAFEFIALMVPHSALENMPLKEAEK